MSLLRSRAPIIDTAQEPRHTPVIIWVDDRRPSRRSDQVMARLCWILTVATILWFGWQFCGRA